MNGVGSVTGPESLARRLVVGLEGPRLGARERAWLLRWRPAGVILFSRNATGRGQLRELCSRLHEVDPALEIVADHEGGPVSQLQEAIGRPPAAWTLGALDDLDLTRRVYRETARRCRSVGLDRVLAPCCDVLVEPRNPVIGSRAFGSDARLVARHAAAATAGLIEGGIASCAKHWPGHGGSRLDSHLGLANAGEGALPGPFEAACEAGGDSVMIGHLLRSGEEPGQRPASLDPAEVAAAAACAGGRRLAWADDVTMGALREFLGGARSGPGASAFEAGMLDPADLPFDWLAEVAAAGCDRLLIRGIPWRALPPAGDPEDRPDSLASPVMPPGAPDRDSDDAPYEEARRRSAEAAGRSGYAAPDRDLVWIDLTADDRWQGAHPERETETLLARLGGDFRTVHRTGAASAQAMPPFDRLLVSSHRPLPREFALPAGGSVAAAGRCLVLGHPSLASDLAGRLPGGWSVNALYDSTAMDYSFRDADRQQSFDTR